VRAANWAVWERASTHPELEGMGTTFCALGVIADGVVAITNVGDSRAYLTRDGSLQVLTDDHTVAGQLLREGKLTAREAAQHPQRHLLTRALGVGTEIAIDTTRLDAVVGDRLLLCTDGVFSSTPDEELAQLLNESDTAQTVADAVVERALANGSDDNASAVVAFITD
jgi:serine/threonine protein phosphatase PrpC